MKLRIFYNLARYVMAALFIFSGFAKAINPFGLSIQLGEYFSAMGLSFLRPLSALGGIVLPAVEMFLGLMLLFGLGRRVAAWGVMLFMSFFTVLTLWIAIYNPVTDCGCFGDLLKITNWQTFIKNIVLLPLAVLLFVWRGRDFSGHGGAAFASSSATSDSTSGRCCRCFCRACGGVWLYCILAVVALALPVYTWFSLPIIDATPYKIGVDVPKAMAVPENGGGEYHTVLIYKEIASGKVREFEIEDTTWYDSSKWEYVDARTTTLVPESLSDISSLPILSAQDAGRDVAAQVLAHDGRLLIVVATNLDKITPRAADRLVSFYTSLRSESGLSNTRAIVLTAQSLAGFNAESPVQVGTPSASGQVGRDGLDTPIKSLIDNGFELFGSDYTVLHTMIQSHSGGAMLLNNGVIIDKWSMNCMPKTVRR